MNADFDADAALDAFDTKSGAFSSYMKQETRDNATGLELVDELLDLLTNLSLYLLYDGNVPYKTCRHCGTAVHEVFGVLVHMSPVMPDSPDFCFVDNPNFTACLNPECSPVDPKEL